MSDLIERQAAYTTLTEYYHHTTEIQHKALREALERVPSAQPKKRTEEHTETHSCDLISRQAAIDHLKKRLYETALNNNTEHPYYEEIADNRVDIWLNELPSAQPDSKELSGTHKALDTVSRQAVIEAINKIFPADPMRDDYTQGITCGAALANIYVAQLPSAQPETHEERTETHACDYINRKDAIDAHYEYCNKHPDAGFPVWSLKILEDLPSAQPDIVACGDCKHWICHDRRCGYWNHGVKPLDWCCHGERRTDE